MYKLGEHFYNGDMVDLSSREEATIRNSTYRFSVLSERLIRLEYSADGMFNNYETAIVKNRRFDLPEFSMQEDEGILTIETSYFSLSYIKNATFSSRSLQVRDENRKVIWYYGQKEVRNFHSCAMSLDNITKLPPLEKGIFSYDGVATIDDSKTLRFDENRNVIKGDTPADYIDIYLFIYKNDFALALKDYFTLTGYPKMIPRYTLGNWWSKECRYTEKEVLDKIDRFKNHEIPLSVFVLDTGWSKEDTRCPEITNGFSFDPRQFSNPAEFIKKVHDKGIKFGVKINPQYGFSTMEDNYQLATKYLPVNKNGSLAFNAADIKNYDVFFKIFLHPLENLGIDFVWNDYFDQNKNNMYLMNYYMHMDLARYNKRDIILSRNCTYDAHLFNILYSGRNVVSWDTLKMLPFYNLNSANIGVSYWSHDIAGSVGGVEDSDLYIRSIQFGVFSPFMRFNTQKGYYYKREPWKWDVVTNRIASDYLKMRHQLIPYLYSECYKYHKEGKILIQPLYYYNLKLYDDENYINQYFFGESFMISPVIKPLDVDMNRTIQKFFMPNGVWYDFKTGKRFLGNHKYISFYSIEDYPIFVKQGSIIPLAGKNSYMTCDNPKDFEVHVFPGISNTYHLYEDDGETYNYLRGKYNITEFDYNYRKSNYTLIIRSIEGDSSVIPDVRDYKIVFRNTKKADNVVVYENQAVLDNIETETTETDFIVYIKNVHTGSQLVVNCYGEDIEIDSVKLIKDDIESILFDIKINTAIKDEIAAIMYDGNLSLGKKRISIKKLKRKGLDQRSVNIFLRLLEYMEM